MVQLALGGYMYLTGEENREPLALPGRQADYLTALSGYAAVQFALWERGRTGRGRFLELTMLETVATLHQYTYVMHTYDGLVRTRNGHRWERSGRFAAYPNVVLPCADGQLCWGLTPDWQWDLLCVMMDREDLQNDPRFDTREKRRANAGDIDEIIVEWAKDRPRADLFAETAGDWGLITAPVLDLKEVLEDPQFRHRELFQRLDHPSAPTAIYPSLPFRSSLGTPRLSRAPLLGEHTEAVLA